MHLLHTIQSIPKILESPSACSHPTLPHVKLSAMQPTTPIYPLTPDQSGALSFLNNFFNEPLPWIHHTEREALICGYAGTGKTWLISQWLSTLCDQDPIPSICIAAPTHKALDVLRQQCGHLPLGFKTLNALLGVSVFRNDEGDMEKSLFGSDLAFDLVVVDEGSMVNAEFFRLLQRAIKEGIIGRVVYVGDPAQLPPVKEDHSPIFDIPAERTFTLREIVRHSGAIITVATYLRRCIEEETSFSLYEIRDLVPAGDRSVSFITKKAIYAWATNAYKANLECRILAWTNAAVIDHNKVMHDICYPGVSFFGIGERVIVNEAYQIRKPKEGQLPSEDDALMNGEIMTVTSCELLPPLLGVVIYEVSAIRLLTGKPVTVQVAFSEPRRAAVHKGLNEDIWALRDYRSNGAHAEKREELVRVRKAIGRLCPLRHSYASTVHKSQGSTYAVAIVDFNDIYRSDDNARLMYVGATRPSQFLVFAKS